LVVSTELVEDEVALLDAVRDGVSLAASVLEEE
jgi:hypothetical protein